MSMSMSRLFGFGSSSASLHSSASVAQEQQETDTAFWSELRTTLERILENKGTLSSAEYMALYTSINSRLNCLVGIGSASMTSTSMARGTRGGHSSGIVETSRRGSQLYYWLTNYITEYLQTLATMLLAVSGTKLLRVYVDHWEKFIFASKLIKGMFAPLQKQWLTGEKRCNGNYSNVQETLEQLWFIYLFKPISSHLVRNVVGLADMKRRGQAIEENYVQTLATALSQLRPENTLEAYMPYRENLGVYLRFFEEPYLQAALGHVQTETSRLRGRKHVRGYLKAVDELIKAEELWSDRLLLPQSGEQLAWALNERLIDRRMVYIDGELAQIFATNDKDDLQRTYRLLDRVRDLGHMQSLSDAFGEHVFREIIDLSPAPTVTNAGSSSSAETLAAYTGSFIDTILDTMDAHGQLLTECFAANADFAISMTAGFRKVVNSNQLQERCQSIPMKLLAEYFHQAVRASGGGARQAGASSIDPETTIRNQLRRAIKLYEYAKRKDDFLAHYALHLARRLLLEQTVSLELERDVVSMVGQLGGMEMTIKLREMLTDIDTSHDMSRSFSQTAAADPTVSVSDVNIKVLKTASWPAPILSESSEWTPPPQLAHICGMFADAYNARHSTRDQQHHGGGSTAKRRLRWLWEYSKCSVQFFFPHSTGRVAKTGYTFVVNTFQLAILMLFTESSGLGTNYGASAGPTLTMKQICNATNIESGIVRAELVIFVKARILVQLDGSNAYQLNDKFNSKRLRIDISAIKKQRRAKEEAKVTANTELDRRWYLMSDIARFMKANRVMAYRELFEGVVGLRSKLFDVTSADFKAALEKVIDQGVVERSEEDFNRLIYNS
ncbi:ubiquitin ligase (cullin) of SCF [Coemansia sp. RSA 486]|nr:ubiquitin ligase (cullin) of SCF [Coemansia sp. RSA 486]KAJ2234042.1 ubiquitin ligase (cullin) of SCF [Coemansia sp. RSA 485]